MSDQILIGTSVMCSKRMLYIMKSICQLAQQLYVYLINNNVSLLHISATVSAKKCSGKTALLNNYKFLAE